MAKSFYLYILLFLGFSASVLGQGKYGTTDERTDAAALLKKEGYTEIVSERTETTKTYEHPSGGKAKVQASLPIHYLNGEGQWVNAERHLKHSEDGTQLGIWKNKLPIVLTLATGQLNMTMDHGTISRGNNFYFTQLDGQGQIISNEESAIGQHKYDGQSLVTYPSIFPGTDLRYHLGSGLSGTNFIINQKPSFGNNVATYAYAEEVRLPKGYSIVPDKTNGQQTELGWQGPLLVLDAKGMSVAIFNNPVFYDDARNTLEGTYTIEQLEGGRFLIAVSVPVWWLNDPARVYPVTIDPSAVAASAAAVSSCFAPAYQAGALPVSIPAGSVLGKTYFETDFYAYNGAWMSEQRHYIQGPVSSSAVFAGTSTTAGTEYWTGFLGVANGHVSTGSVNITWHVQRTWGGSGCNTNYNYLTYRYVMVFYGPCPNDNVAHNGGNIYTVPCGTASTLGVGRGEYVNFNVTTGIGYEFSTCGTTIAFDTELSGYNGGSGAALFYNDDFGPACTTTDKASVQWNSTFTGTLRVLVDQFNTTGLVNCVGGLGGPGSAVLGYRQLTTITNNTSAAAICQSSTKTLSATLGGVHNSPTIGWSITSGGGSISGTTYTPGAYSGPVTISATVGACSSPVTFTVDPQPVVSASIGLSTTALCAGGSITVTRNGAINGQDRWWMSRDGVQWAEFVDEYVGQSSFTRTLTVPGTYQVYHHPWGGECGWSGWTLGRFSATITVYAQPTITLTGNNQSICSGANAAAFSASISGGTGCGVQWQSSIDGSTWADISGATASSYTPTGLTNSTFYRARTNACGVGCTQATSEVRFVAVTPAPTVQTHPTPTSQSVCEGTNIAYSSQANIGSGTVRYRLVLTSAHGANWHGIQEIRGYNTAGTEQALTCLGASSATYTASICADASYGAGNAFDGAYPVSNSPASTAQWLTPAQSTSAGTPNTNWQNFATVNPFYSPEWIEFSAPSPLSEIWVYNGRYDVGNESTCFKDFYILVSYNSGTTWSKVKEGTMAAATGLNGNNNKFVIEPTYTWKQGTTTVGSGKTLTLNNVTTANSGNYTVELTYGCATATSNVAALTVTVQPTISVSGATDVCYNAGTTLTATASGGTGTCSFQWQYWNGSTWVNTGTNANTLATGNLTVSRVYRCVRTCTGTNCTTATSNEHTVTVDAAPIIATNPQSVAICPGANTTLTGSVRAIDWKDASNWDFSGNITWDATQQAWRCQGYCTMYLKSTVAPAINSANSYNIEVDVFRTVNQGQLFYWGGDRLNASFAHLNGYGGTYDYSAASAQQPPVGVWKTYQAIGKTGTAASAAGWGSAADATAYYRVGGLINYNGASTEITYIRNIKFYYDNVHHIIDNPVTYQWKKNGTNIGGATSASYTITGATTASAGSYTLDAINACGTVTSAPAVVIVNPVPTTPTIAVTSGSTTGCGSVNATLQATSSIAGNALSLNGSSSYNVGNPAALQITGNMTIEMWLRPTDFSQRRNPWGKAYGGEGTITQETDGSLNFFWGFGGGNSANGTYTALNSGTTLTLNQWNHVAIVRDMTNNVVRWYINGVQTNSMVPPYAGSVSTLDATIGSNYTGFGYTGQIDELRVWNTARTATEIQNNMNTVVAPFLSSLAGYWRMDETTGNITDASGSNLPVTVTGAPAFVTSTAPIAPAYAWSPATQLNTTVGSTVITTATASRTYTVTATSPLGCATSANTISVTVNPIPAAAATNTGPYCPGATISLTTTAVAGASYSWSGPGGWTGTGQSPTRASATTAMSGSYTVTVTNNGCTATSSTTVTVNPTPVAAATNTGPYCPGGTISLTTTAVAGASYSWSGPGGWTGTGQSPTRASATTAMSGSYTVTVTSNSCTATSSTTVTVNPTPAAAATNTGPYCPGASISLTTTAVAGASFSWSGPGGWTGTGQSPTRASATTAMSGSYTVTVTSNSCTATSSTTVTVNATPAAAATNTGPYCPGGTISLTTTAVAGASYSWSGPGGWTGTGQSPTRAAATTAMSGSYTVTVTSNSCTATSSTTVTVNATPAAAATNTGPYCPGGTISLTTTAVAGATYAWSGPGGWTGSGQSPTRASATTAMSGSYTVTVTSNSCTATSSTTVTVNPTPAAAATNTGPYCPGASISLTTTAVAGATYAWSGPGGWTGSGQSPTRASATTAMSGSYTVTVTSNSCTATSSTTVTVNATPAAAASNTGPYCPGGTISLTTTAVAGATYAWSGPGGWTGTGQSPTRASATTAMSGSYTVTVTSNSCTATSSTTVTVNPTPAAAATNTGPYCVNGTISLTTTLVAGATYSWSGPGGWTTTGQSPTRASATPAMAGSYTVTVTASGCTATSSTTVSVSQPSASGVNTIISPATLANGDYLWVGQSSVNWNAAANWYQFDGTNFQPAAALPTTTSDVYIVPTDAGCITANTATVNVTSNVRGIHIGTGATLAFGSSQRLNVYGDWTNNGAITNSGTSTVAFIGTATQTVNTGGTGTAPNKRFAQVIVDKTAGSVIQNGAILMTSNFTITNGIWDNTPGNAAVQVQGNWDNGGTGQFLAGTSTVTFNSSSARNITTGYTTGNPTGKTFYSISKAGTGTHTLVGDLVGTLDLSITAGTISTSSSGYNISFNRDIVMRGGTLSGENSTIFANRHITVGNTSGVGTLTCVNCTLTSTFDWNVGVVAGNTGTITLSSGSIVNVGRNMLLNNGSFTANDATINLVGNWTNSGVTITPGTSIVKFQGTTNTSTTITSGGQSFFKVNIERNAATTTTTVLDNMDVLDELKLVTGTLIVNQDVVGTAEKVDISTTGRLTLKAVTTGTKGGELRVNP